LNIAVVNKDQYTDSNNKGNYSQKSSDNKLNSYFPQFNRNSSNTQLKTNPMPLTNEFKVKTTERKNDTYNFGTLGNNKFNVILLDKDNSTKYYGKEEPKIDFLRSNSYSKKKDEQNTSNAYTKYYEVNL